MRNLTKTLAAVSMLAPASAYPLGIGEIKLHSALNQNLDAEIALVLSSNENISEVIVRIAPPEKFDEAGVPWSYFLSKIKFDSVTKADGTTVVKLSSQEALREPFLDFLLEVRWAKGNMYREFTVLIDPPTAYTQPVIPVVQKAQQLTGVKQKDASVVESNVETSGIIENYGPTNNRDSLWKIADKTNVYSDVSIEQMMIAIYKANPKAFYKNNVNALLANTSLKIPDKKVILKLSQKKALAEFRRQNKVWKQDLVVTAQAKKTVSDKPILKSQLELEAPVEAEIKDKVVVTEANVLKQEAIKTDIKGLAKLPSEESGGIQTRLDKLEQQLEMMQKMLVLKDEQIAALQSREVKTPTNINISQDQSVQPKKETKPVQAKVKAEAVIKSEPKTIAKGVIKPKPKPILKPVVQPEPGFMSDSMSMIIGGVGAAIIALLGLLWWRKREVESEADGESMFATASEISLPDSSEEVLIPSMDDATAYDVGTVGESSFLSEFTPSDFDAFDSDQNEVDPISEADVYLAYGRYQQAEDLMRQAITEQPERDECKLKLLEIFYANENKDAFEVYATELEGSEKNKDQEFWSKVVEMGAELIPESSLFTSGENDKVSFEVEASPEKNDITTILNDTPDITESADTSSASVDFDLSVFDEEKNNSDGGVEVNKEDGLDFDLSVFDLDEKESAGIKKTELSDNQDIETMDFDLNTIENESNTVNDIKTVEMDVDFSDFPLDNSDSNDDETDKVMNELPKETEIFDEFDFDSDASEAVDEIESGVSDLTDMDELETKIDLAKAYIDMGDVDAAKGIAEEVKNKGNSEQKEAAQEIIDQLNS